MVTRSMGAVLLTLMAVGVQAQDPTLADLIPEAKWKTTGIEKLTSPERDVLRDEILVFLKRYRASLTDGVAVIAPSVSTSMKAREIRARLGKREVSFRFAEAVLVVVRSSLFNPLQHGYDSVGELQRDADSQLNISGPKYHVYVYSMDDDLRVTQVSHRSFEAE